MDDIYEVGCSKKFVSFVCVCGGGVCVCVCVACLNRKDT